MRRRDYFSTLFPQGIPTLWCPLISHYKAEGSFDSERMAAHIDHLSPYVQAFLAPGSTGDGWEMQPEERSELIELLLPLAEQINGHLLVGVLETERGRAAAAVESVKATYAPGETPGYIGVTITAPRGSDLSQTEIFDEISAVLEQGVPTGLYQLPQITENEIDPCTVEDLAKKYSNFYLFKDTSGKDKVARSGRMPDDLFLVRGAEGNYADWLKGLGGPYHGFLLSTANNFAPQLARILDLSSLASAQGAGGAHSIEASEAAEEARSISEILSTVVETAFKSVSELPFGNPFANSNKAIDHIMAYGEEFEKVEPPLTHSGNRIPAKIETDLAGLLRRHNLFPQKGYLE